MPKTDLLPTMPVSEACELLRRHHYSDEAQAVADRYYALVEERDSLLEALRWAEDAFVRIQLDHHNSAGSRELAETAKRHLRPVIAKAEGR